MPLSATAHSIPGTLRQEVLVDGRHRLCTDEPARLGGQGSAPGPYQFLPAAVASCVATSLVMYARTKGWDLGELSVDADYDPRATPRRCAVRVTLGSDLTAEQLQRLEKVARACPVRRSLEAGVEFSESIVCAGRDTEVAA
jgi:putative redox protein